MIIELNYSIVGSHERNENDCPIAKELSDFFVLGLTENENLNGSPTSDNNRVPQCSALMFLREPVQDTAANKFAAGHVSLKNCRPDRKEVELFKRSVRFTVTIELYRQTRRLRDNVWHFRHEIFRRTAGVREGGRGSRREVREGERRRGQRELKLGSLGWPFELNVNSTRVRGKRYGEIRITGERP